MQESVWDRLQEIYAATIALPRAERSVFVANACADDSRLRHQVNSLLKVSDSGGLLDSPIVRFSLLPDNLVGMTLDERYLVERQLDHGGMNQVYFALDLRLSRRRVVVKILSSTLLPDSYARNKFQQEIEALARIRHEGVVNVLDSGEAADGRPYLVMECVEGETLRSQIPTEGMNLERAAPILKQLGAALEHVHEQGIFHRDLKPENVMLKHGTDTVVLVDFGIAKVKDSLVAPSTVNGPTAGTVVYMSPEQLKGERITTASDIFSMSVIAYELLTSRRPFNPTTASQLLELQRAGVAVKPTSLRPNLPTRAQQLILRGLSFKATNRPQSAKQLGDELAQALIYEASQPKTKWQLRPGKKAFVVAAVLITLLSAAGLLAFHQYRADSTRSVNHALTYWLMVQRTRAGRNYKEPFKSNGTETLDEGDKFQLDVSSSDPGYIYIFSETRPALNDTSFKMIYPTPAINKGSASVGAGQPIETDRLIGSTGTDNFWIVWSASTVPQFESVKTEAFDSTGGLTETNLETVKEFLRTKSLEIETHLTRDELSETTMVQGKNEMLITLVKIKHR
ncbi:MAG TPA: serine/threonine-protein kinase [Pyrinomonadaceae bacterium]